ncbi:OLC1v1011882C1 [Oldenlandia corymbosa var. corymbosa]|uniref:OLC1v1011882C1 n=1 Tax=Oldenlandia corymbosa var. corymbosa TaxID=529605 RepID=A0AAV1DUQ0_OLDCO|nr:OLC1v1011882C1 [Oldenlandia corymbosa var. corymbosa]
MEVLGCKLPVQFADYGLTSRRLPTLKPVAASWRWSHTVDAATAEAGNAANPPHDSSSLLVKKAATEISPVLRGTSVFLIGMNCSIKSNVGKLLADALRYYFFDSDSLVEEATGVKSSARSLVDLDEEGFRESETEVLKQLSSMGRLIVSAGNGAVQSVSNLALLRHGISIWIDVPLDMIAREVLAEDNFIQLSKSLESTNSKSSHSEVLMQLTRLYEKSQTGYAAADSTVSLLSKKFHSRWGYLGSFEVDSLCLTAVPFATGIASKLGYQDLDELTVEDIALEVLRELQKLTRVKKMMEAAARPF